MIQRIAVAGLLGACVVLAYSADAFAQQGKYPDVFNAKPMYTVLPNRTESGPDNAVTTPLAQWNGSFVDLKKRTVNYTMVGTDPSQGGVSTTVPVFIIPIKMVYGPTNGNLTFDPLTETVSNGLTVVNNIIASPIFNPGVNFKQGGTNLGTTQYVDAYQRGSFWKYVKKNTGYHVLLGTPTVLKEMVIKVPASLGSVVNNPYGSGIVGTYDLNTFDAKARSYMKRYTEITPGALPVFVTYNVYLSLGGCCYAGYHSAVGKPPGSQTYVYATYLDSVGAFGQDVSALSHETAEWMDDPFGNNYVVDCTSDGGLLEVADPLENGPSYGAYPYTLGGFTYNLQSLVFINYFGAPKNTSLHGWYAFQDDMSQVCPN